ADQARAIGRERDSCNVADLAERPPDEEPTGIFEHGRGAIAAVGGEPVSLRTEGESPYMARMGCAQWLEQRVPGLHVPAVDLALANRGHKTVSVWAECDSKNDAGMMDQGAVNSGSLLDIP